MQRATTLLPLIHMVAEAALKPMRDPALAPYTATAARPTTVTDTEPVVATLLSAKELTLVASWVRNDDKSANCFMEDNAIVNAFPMPTAVFNVKLVSLCHKDRGAAVGMTLHVKENEACPPILLPFKINDQDPELGKFKVKTFEIVTELKEKDFERMLVWDATLAMLDIETAVPLDNLRINVVSVFHTVAIHAEFSKETRGVKLEELKPMPSIVTLIDPELGEFLRTAPFPSKRYTEIAK